MGTSRRAHAQAAPPRYVEGNATDGGDPRAIVLELLREHGWNATSFQVLERGFSYWFDPSSTACVAYVDTGAAWVAAGAPIGSDMGASAERFVAAARQQGRRACFFAVEDRFLANSGGLASMPIGEQPSWDPRRWPAILSRHRSLREQLRRARAKGVSIQTVSPAELLDAESALGERLHELVLRWLRSRRMPPMGFLVDVQLFDFFDERRCFVAKYKDRIVGLLGAVPIYKRRGWFFEDLLREPHAPNGTTELLVDAAMRATAAEGSGYATLGLAPLAGRLPPWLRFVRDCTRVLYDFEGLRRFKAKLEPAAWTPIHLAWPRDLSGGRALLDALAAFTIRPLDDKRHRASISRFGLETLAHSPSLGVRALAVCLVPWTLALALAPTARFFPSPIVQAAWVVFDVVLGAAMISLALRWRDGLARALAFATTADAVLTLTEALVDGPRRLHSALDVVIAIVACVGPTAAALQLWAAVTLRARREARVIVSETSRSRP